MTRMKCSFDGLRVQLARQYNKLAATKLSQEQAEIMVEMQTLMLALMCCEDERDQPNDCNSLIGFVLINDPVPTRKEDK